METNNHRQTAVPCEFAAALIAVVYREADQKECEEFAAHAQTCRACAEEFAAFGSLAGDLQVWREADFDHLPTPVFQMPPTVEKVSPWQKLTAFLFPGGAVLNPATAFAAFAVCALLLAIIGLAFFGNSAAPEIVQVTTPESTPPNVSPKIQPSPEKPAVIVPIQSPDAETPSIKPAARTKSASPVEKKSVPAQAPREAKRPAPKKGAPRNTEAFDDLIPADETDETPRLSDLFDEIIDSK